MRELQRNLRGGFTAKARYYTDWSRDAQRRRNYSVMSNVWEYIVTSLVQESGIEVGTKQKKRV